MAVSPLQGPFSSERALSGLSSLHTASRKCQHRPYCTDLPTLLDKTREIGGLKSRSRLESSNKAGLPSWRMRCSSKFGSSSRARLSVRPPLWQNSCPSRILTICLGLRRSEALRAHCNRYFSYSRRMHPVCHPLRIY